MTTKNTIDFQSFKMLGRMSWDTRTQPASLDQNEPNPFTESTGTSYFTPEGVGSSRIDVRNTENKNCWLFNFSCISFDI